MLVSAFSQLSSVSKLLTIVQRGSGTSASTSCGYLVELGGIIRYQPTNASAAKGRLFRLLTPPSYTPLAERSHRGGRDLTPTQTGDRIAETWRLRRCVAS